ncbi:MAG TPA: MerR family transcriptional regulator [Gemmatimonadaceae bacterium]
MQKRLGVTRRQLEYWRREQIVCPSARSDGGGQHRYSDRDLRKLRLLRVLMADPDGLSLQRAAPKLDALHREVEAMIEVARAESASAAVQALRGR